MQLEKYYPDGNIPQDIQAMLLLVGNEPSLESLWGLMDLAWATTKANSDNPLSMDDFYAHPVWLLNGFFTETHQDSIDNREQFACYIANDKPQRVADFGGGFGAFARILAEKCPDTIIEIVEPYPTEMARILCGKFSNIRFVEKLTGEYDVITALDVLEHVIKPLELVHHFAEHVKKDGYMLMANCFFPVIKCHLPCTFYLRYKFDFLLSKMGISCDEQVLYGKKYKVSDTLKHPDLVKVWNMYAKLYFIVYEDYQKYKAMFKLVIKKMLRK